MSILGSPRRNSIGRDDALVVVAVALASGVLAALAGCRPTGTYAIDVVLTGATAAFVTWLGASVPWWALIAGSAGAAMAAAAGGQWILIAVGWVALAVSVWIASRRANLPWLRAAVVAGVVQVALRLGWDPFFLASALVAAVLLGVLVVTGVRRRQRHVRRRVYWSGAALAVLVIAAGAGFGFSGAQARSEASRGYTAMLDGLEFVQRGETARGAQILRGAAVDLGSAHDDLGAPWAQPVRLVPGLAQNRNSTHEVLGRAAEAATSAADTLDRVDIDQLRVVDGTVDLAAFDVLLEPLAELERTIVDLRGALREASSDWLVEPLRERFDRAEERAAQVHRQAAGTAELARLGPALLGADGPRRYFVAFVNPAETRGTGGLMGNWTELTVDGGRISESASGRTAELQRALGEHRPVELDAPDWYFERFEAFDINDPETGPGGNAWVHGNMTADMPTAGSVFAQLYEAATGRAVDGVFMIDPAAIAALLDVTGSVELPSIDFTLTASNAEEFLLFGQYEFLEGEREDFLEEASEATIDRILNSTLPPPHEMAQKMSEAALHGHLLGYFVRDEEQDFMALAGMDGALPEWGVDTSGDALAVLNDNLGANKIDSFLQRSITYRATYDPPTGETSATLAIEFHNAAPASGLDDYVLGSGERRPRGTNRTLVSILSPLRVESVYVDGREVLPFERTENGLEAAVLSIEIPPGGTVVVDAEMQGVIGSELYHLLYRPQALPNADAVDIEVRSTAGDLLVRHDEPLRRRTVLSELGIWAWR